VRVNGVAPKNERARALGKVLLGTGGALLVLALVCQRTLAARFDPVRIATDEAQRELGRARIEFALLGLVLAALGAFALTRRGERTLCGRKWFARTLVASLALALPVFVLERALAPFVEKPTTIFERDPDLGWHLKPGAVDFWGGEPVRINANGMRGPVRPFAKPAGTQRVLFLGDSVAFGFGVADDSRTVPARAERTLTQALGSPVECINAAVDGYSTWQEHWVLKRTGLRYQPDVVVLCFVLNDVFERFFLRGFGGKREGFQLEHTLSAHTPAWVQTSAIAWFARELRGRFEYGADTQAGARQSETMDVYALLFEPERPDVRDAWTSTLSDLDAFVRTCRERNVPVVLVLFPFATQLYRPELDSPRAILEPFAAQRDVPFVDVRPVYFAAVQRGEVTIEDLYLDPCHPKAAGLELAADAIARMLVARQLLTPR
jgi:lysophospholipase L1-like esterase